MYHHTSKVSRTLLKKPQIVIQFAKSHGSLDLNLGAKRLILAGYTRSQSCLNIDGSYSKVESFLNQDFFSYLQHKKTLEKA